MAFVNQIHKASLIVRFQIERENCYLVGVEWLEQIVDDHRATPLQDRLLATKKHLYQLRHLGQSCETMFITACRRSFILYESFA